MSASPVRYELAEGIATITIDRPEAKNALNQAVREGLWAALRRFVHEDAALVAVLGSTGDVFCAGADLKEMAAVGLEVPPPDFLPQLGRNLHTEKPVIAAVQGPAYAGGFALAQMCDLCVASEDARFGITEAKWSRGAPWAAPLPWLIPPRVALELMVTAEPLTAARAHAIGLVNRVVPHDALLPTVRAWAEDVAANCSPTSMRIMKRQVYQNLTDSLEHAEKESIRLMIESFDRPDFREGVTSFLEKRPPTFERVKI